MVRLAADEIINSTSKFAIGLICRAIFTKIEGTVSNTERSCISSEIYFYELAIPYFDPEKSDNYQNLNQNKI